MALTSLTLNVAVAWSLSRAITGTSPNTQQGQQSYNLAGLAAQYNNVYYQQATILSGVNLDFDVYNFAALTGETLTPSQWLTLFLLPTGTGAGCVLTPSGVNPLPLGLTGSQVIPVPGVWLVSYGPAGPGGTVSPTQRKFNINNNGSGTLTMGAFVLVAA